MIEQLELLEKAIAEVQETIAQLKEEKNKLQLEVAELRSTIEDRDLEILQLQEDAQKNEQQRETDKNEIVNKLQSLLGQMNTMTEDDKEEEEEAKAEAQPQQPRYNNNNGYNNNGFRF